jgi:hypothetical protein
MFRFYMEFILNNSEKLTNLKEIISINKHMLHNIKHKKRTLNRYGGATSDFDLVEECKKNPTDCNKKIEDFKNSTISIINELGSNFNTQSMEIKKVHEALTELIKYITMLSNMAKEANLDKIKSQLGELKQIVEEKIKN